MEMQGDMSENISVFTISVRSEWTDVINEGLRGGEVWLLTLPVTHPAWKSHPSLEAGSLP